MPHDDGDGMNPFALNRIPEPLPRARRSALRTTVPMKRTRRGRLSVLQRYSERTGQPVYVPLSQFPLHEDWATQVQGWVLQ